MMSLYMKRVLFIVVLIGVFLLCLWKMNQEYDELARYPHELSEEQRNLVLQYLDSTQINDLVTQKIEPDQFLPYIEIEGFDLANTLWYDAAYQARKEDRSYIVSFINKYRDDMKYEQLSMLLKNYSYNELTRFYDEKDTYLENASLVDTIDMFTILKKNQTLYTYEPDTLVTINDLPHSSNIQQNDMLIQEVVVQPIKDLIQAAKAQKSLQSIKLVSAYISYEDQVSLYEKAKDTYKDDIQRYVDYPGRNEAQLGYTICLEFTNEQTKEEEEKDETVNQQDVWLKDNAYKYGFIIRYPKQKETITQKAYQPYTLRYVGIDLAKYMHDHNLVLEEVSEDILQSYRS